MSFHYEVVAEMSAVTLFRQKFLESVSKTKCCQMFRLVAPGIPNFWEFKVGKDIFTLSFSEQADERTVRLSIDSMTLDLTEIIVSTIQSVATDYLINFLKPLSKVSKDELDKRVKARMETLEVMLVPQTLWEVQETKKE